MLRPSSLVPCPTSTDDPSPIEESEVEALLRLHDEGKFEPVKVELPDLPADASLPQRMVVAFYARVCGLRRAAGDYRDVAFACRWVAGKVGLPRQTVWRALDELCLAGVLHRGEPLPGRERRGTATWCPGPAEDTEGAT